MATLMDVDGEQVFPLALGLVVVVEGDLKGVAVNGPFSFRASSVGDNEPDLHCRETVT